MTADLATAALAVCAVFIAAQAAFYATTRTTDSYARRQLGQRRAGGPGLWLVAFVAAVVCVTVPAALVVFVLRLAAEGLR